MKTCIACLNETRSILWGGFGDMYWVGKYCQFGNELFRIIEHRTVRII